MREGPSEHLSWRELSCHDEARTPYPVEWRGDRASVLGYAFECVREACGDRPIPILSAYRTREWNRIMPGGPGAKESQHPEGTALDLGTPRRLTRLHFHQRILAVALVIAPIIGIGLYPWGVHIDTRHGYRLVRWNGNRRRADG